MTTVDLPPPSCRLGYTDDDLAALLPSYGRTLDELWAWMVGQTGALCEGRQWDPATGSYVEACGGAAHGPVVYPWDVRTFLRRGPVLD